MKQQLLKLDWDSDFFHFNVCRIEGLIENHEDARAIDCMMEAGNFKLAYYASSKELFLEPTHTLEIKLVDKKTKYIKEVGSTAKYYPSISSYEYDYPNGILLDLAVQSGIYSRFNIDKKIGQAKFEELYKLWVIKSVRKELAKEVFVHRLHNDITGFVTVSEKDNRADFEMVAVESNHRKKGIGSMLFNHAEKWAYDHRYHHIQVVTQGDNIPACKFYENMGCAIETMQYFYHIWRRDKS